MSAFRRTELEAMMFRVVVAVILIAGASSALAQTGASRQAAAPADPIVALTAELRALRAELAESARANLRSQLLVARLQLQEQRLIYLDRQRSEIASRLLATEQERLRAEGSMKMFAGDANLSAQERKEMDFMTSQFKAQLQLQQVAEQQLRSEENQLLNAINTEQARWNDFSNRLDELERSLSQR